eukprot:2111194-Prymnesium_polylepis.1
MLCSTDFATWVTQELEFDEPYDDMLMPWQRYVVYPTLFQRYTEQETSTHATPMFANTPLGVLRNLTFPPACYCLIEIVNVFGFWMCLGLIVALMPCCAQRQHRERFNSSC